jgi:membrane-associated protein
VAGAADMNYRSFFLYNLVGGFVWTWGITLIGYLFIDKIPGLKERMDIALIGIVFVSLLPLIAHQISERRKKHTA